MGGPVEPLSGPGLQRGGGVLCHRLNTRNCYDVFNVTGLIYVFLILWFMQMEMVRGYHKAVVAFPHHI